jgi:regulation of enolase protein 1 (concanavalin A-like superfamily)
MRVAHLLKAPEQVEVGAYACSPTGRGFYCRFVWLEISDNQWFYERG